MPVDTRVSALAEAVGADIKALRMQRDFISAGLTAPLAITGTGAVIANDTSNPSPTAGYTLFDQTISTVVGQDVSVDISVPYMQITTSALVMMHAWADGEWIGTCVSRVTTGAASGNSIEPRFSFVAADTSTQIVIKIGVTVSTQTLTLFNRLGYASQPSMVITRYGGVL